MSYVAIKAENLSKAYQLGEFSTGTLSRDIQRRIALMRGKEDPYLKIGETNDRTSKGSSDIVWSLKDIDFEVNQGDAVGIIGRNGAGKSTLLKVLSRVTTPTTGSVKIKGRVASLLEVGTGFHPELTGRENIFLNGAILGMRKFEIKKHFDAIVDFAGVERYIDTPVKRYSSGMYVRLAFAVAAHLESEILVVDEVLAVGDAEFQKKCIGKMGDVSKGEGRTVLFVSHNMSSVQALCNQGIMMQYGKVVSMGKIESIIPQYLSSNKTREQEQISARTDRKGNGKALFHDYSLVNDQNDTINTFIVGKTCKVILGINITTEDPIMHFHVALSLMDSYERRVANFSSEYSDNFDYSKLKRGMNYVELTIPHLPVVEGIYTATLYSRVNNEISDWVENAFSLDIENGLFFSNGKLPAASHVSVLIDHQFTIS
ncbi:ABC transporter ATP-binding protein [Mucilaginibacter lacusdianchii]|uniref:ABC transporter ATP-binding protein n=1 Tax=Mucilaginibacter lacusdianchii TaxID=2684211 RepID=UPI00131D8B9D|nr:ABC transporter ATP-binding protein [Mucilaginibacter sp. JXJ CY 39]